MGYWWNVLVVVMILVPTIILFDDIRGYGHGQGTTSDLARAWLRISFKTGAAGAVALLLYQMAFR